MDAVNAVSKHLCANQEHPTLKTLTGQDKADYVRLFEAAGVAIERRYGAMTITCTSCSFGSEAAQTQCLCPCHIGQSARSRAGGRRVPLRDHDVQGAL